MTGRRLLRVKVLQVLYAYFRSGFDSKKQAENALFSSIDEIYLLYIFLLEIPLIFREIATKKLIGSKKKFNPDLTLEKKHLYLKYNYLHKLFSTHPVYLQNQFKIKQFHDKEIFNQIYAELISSKKLKELAILGKNDFESNIAILKYFYKRIIPESNKFIYFLEEQSIFWEYNEIDYVLNIVIKTIEKITPKDTTLNIFNKFSNAKEDKNYIKKLLENTIDSSEDLELTIAETSKNWSNDRIALMDMLIIKMGINEARLFEEIPIKVTLNEYIEMSKWYSTPKSSIFVNGVLNQIIK